MSQTVQWRINRVKAYARKLNATLAMGDEMIQFNVHLARNDVFKRYLGQAEHLFRKSISIADNTQLPADYLRYAENATYTTGGNTYPFVYIPAEKIPSVKAQPFFKAYADQPKLAIFDGKLHTYPSGITVDNWEYYWRPVDLWASDHSILGTQTDNMPQELEFHIVRGAFERTIIMQMGRRAAQQFLEKNRSEVEKVTAEFYAESFGAVQQDLRAKGDTP